MCKFPHWPIIFQNHTFGGKFLSQSYSQKIQWDLSYELIQWDLSYELIQWDLSYELMQWDLSYELMQKLFAKI